MGRKSPDKQAGRKKGLALLRVCNLTKHTVVYWAVLLIVSGSLLALELGGWHHRSGLAGTGFWQNVIAPFGRELELNFVNLYISQISTTFLVTAFLSFLGGKEDPIYWTSAMEYKLINPKGTSLRDITWYCIGTLITSLVAVFFRAALMFLFSFGINLLGLSVITCRMILAFFAREEVKRQLLQEFLQADGGKRDEMLDQMEARIAQAAHNCDAGYLRECVVFFRRLNETEGFAFTQTHFDRLRWILQIIPDRLDDVRQAVFSVLRGFLSSKGSVFQARDCRGRVVFNENIPTLESLQSECDRVKQERTEKEQQLEELNKTRKTRRVKKQIAALEQEIASLDRMRRILMSSQRPYVRATSPEKDNRRRLQEDVLRILRNNSRNSALTERDAYRWCENATGLSKENIAEFFILVWTQKSSKMYFRRDFELFIALLKEAYDNHIALDDYIASLEELHRFVATGMKRLDAATGEECIAYCYDWNDTLLLFRCVCDDNAWIDRDRMRFLREVLSYSLVLTEEKKAQLRKLVNDSSQLADCDKAALLETMN